MDHERSIAAQSERHAMRTYENSKRESAKDAELAALRAEIAKLREALDWASKLDLEHKDNHPCPDLGLRAMYRQKWREARDAAGWLEGKP